MGSPSECIQAALANAVVRRRTGRGGGTRTDPSKRPPTGRSVQREQPLWVGSIVEHGHTQAAAGSPGTKMVQAMRQRGDAGDVACG